MSAGDRFNQRLVQALDRLAWGCADLRRQLVERGLWPAPRVTLATPAGARFVALGTRLRPAADQRAPGGLLVPRGDCLWGTLHLPAMGRKELRAAVDEALWRVSPLPPEQMFCAWSAMPEPQGGWQVRWGVSRRDAHPGLAPQAPVFLEHEDTRVALPVLREASDTPGVRWRRVGAGALALVVLAALLSPAFLPLALKRQAVARAMAHVQALEPQAAPLRQQLDALRQQADLAEGLRAAGQAQLPLASVLELLSATVPDGAWLERVEANGASLRVVGVADNAGELLALLTRQPRLADVHASAASVRDNTLGKERFTAEMRWRDATVPGSAPASAPEAQP